MRHLGDTPVIIGVMLVVALLLRVVLGRWREGLFVIAAVSGQAVVFISTTALVERERPKVEQLDSSPPTSSFPSGHTGAALALYLAIAVVAIRAVRPRWARCLIAGLCLIPALLVGFARLYRGMHHPSDLAGAIINASLCLWLAARVVLDGPLPEGHPRQRSRHGAGELAHAQPAGSSTVGTPQGEGGNPSHDDRTRAGASP
jgi:undecaprenyl-diphosphatase